VIDDQLRFHHGLALARDALESRAPLRQEFTDRRAAAPHEVIHANVNDGGVPRVSSMNRTFQELLGEYSVR